MKTFNLINYILDFQYRKYFLEQLDLMLHPWKHFKKIVTFLKDNIFEETEVFKVVPSSLYEYIHSREVVIEKRKEALCVSIIVSTSNRLNLINDSQREILRAA